MLTAVGLTRRFGGNLAVDGASFTIAAGEVVALIGPNGAGKTTLFNLVAGQLRPDRGEVRLDGRRIDGTPAHRMRRLGVARTFQIAEIFAGLTLRQNVQLALAAAAGHALSAARSLDAMAPDAADALLAQVGFAGASARPAGDLAYGDIKRLELAMALAPGAAGAPPRLLLMDEPTAGMAASERVGMMAEATAFARAHGAAVLFTEHDMGVVFGHAGRILVLDRGRLIADGPPEAVRADAEVRRIYLGTGR